MTQNKKCKQCYYKLSILVENNVWFMFMVYVGINRFLINAYSDVEWIELCTYVIIIQALDTLVRKFIFALIVLYSCIYISILLFIVLLFFVVFKMLNKRKQQSNEKKKTNICVFIWISIPVLLSIWISRVYT